MARGRYGSADYLDLGSWNVICDSCGGKFKAQDTRKRWDGMRVCEADFEHRHPQDFVRGRRDRQAVPDARPEQTGYTIPMDMSSMRIDDEISPIDYQGDHFVDYNEVTADDL